MLSIKSNRLQNIMTKIALSWCLNCYSIQCAFVSCVEWLLKLIWHLPVQYLTSISTFKRSVMIQIPDIRLPLLLSNFPLPLHVCLVLNIHLWNVLQCDFRPFTIQWGSKYLTSATSEYHNLIDREMNGLAKHLIVFGYITRQTIWLINRHSGHDLGW